MAYALVGHDAPVHTSVAVNGQQASIHNTVMVLVGSFLKEACPKSHQLKFSRAAIIKVYVQFNKDKCSVKVSSLRQWKLRAEQNASICLVKEPLKNEFTSIRRASDQKQHGNRQRQNVK